jgi:hypothetical protein
MKPARSNLSTLLAVGLLSISCIASAQEGNGGASGENRENRAASVAAPGGTASGGIPTRNPSVAGTDASEFPACSKVPTEDDVAVAKKTYELANRFMGDAEYERASLYFRDAYRSDCTAHRLLNFIARAEELRGHRGEAIRALETYLERAPKASDRVAVERRMAHLRAQGSSALPSSANGTGQGPGTGAEGSAGNEALKDKKPSERQDLPATVGVWGPWVVAGIGAAALGTGAVVYGLGTSRVSQVEEACGARRCTNAEDAQRGNEGRRWQAAGAVVGGVGAVVTLGGAAWFAWEKLRGRPEGDVAVQPTVGPSFAGVSVGGCF